MTDRHTIRTLDATDLDATDLDALAALHAKTFPFEPWDRAALDEVLAMTGAFGRIIPASVPRAAAEHRPRGLLGFSLGLRLGPECELLSIGVEPAARGRGLGRALLADFLALCGAAGVRRILLEVAEDNVAARALYASLGFAEVGRRPDYYRRAGNTRAAALQLAKVIAQ